MADSNISHPIHAKFYDRLNAGAEENIFPPHREYLAAGLKGDVLEIGTGTGSMIHYYEDTWQNGSELSIHAIEPDPNMRQQAIEAADTAKVPIKIIDGRAEDITFPDETFDIVICSLILCSVNDLDEALAEINRVLRPQGEFRFFEHVQSPGMRGTVESVISPLWRPIAAGCRIDRRTGDRIAESFERTEVTHFDIGSLDTFPVRRFVRGRGYRI